MDNLAENFQLQPENGIFISSWYSDPSDESLSELAPLLAHLVLTKVESVSKSLTEIRQEMLRDIKKGRKHRNKYKYTWQ